MNVKKHFQFDNTRDFPFYNHNPRLSKTAWVVLLLAVVMGYLSLGIIDDELISGILFCFIILIPLLYFSKWDYKLLFHRPTKNEVLLALLMFIGYMIYALVIDSVLTYFGLSVVSSTSGGSSDNVFTIIAMVFSLMGEELLKFIPLMFFMRLFYKISNRRDLSFVLSSAIIMIFFGLLHYDFTSAIWSCLLIQGLGTIFELYGYYKTKNLLVPYMSHLFTDVFIVILVLIGI